MASACRASLRPRTFTFPRAPRFNSGAPPVSTESVWFLSSPTHQPQPGTLEATSPSPTSRSRGGSMTARGSEAGGGWRLPLATSRLSALDEQFGPSTATMWKDVSKRLGASGHLRDHLREMAGKRRETEVKRKAAEALKFIEMHRAQQTLERYLDETGGMDSMPMPMPMPMQAEDAERERAYAHPSHLPSHSCRANTQTVQTVVDVPVIPSLSVQEQNDTRKVLARLGYEDPGLDAPSSIQEGRSQHPLSSVPSHQSLSFARPEGAAWQGDTLDLPGGLVDTRHQATSTSSLLSMCKEVERQGLTEAAGGTSQSPGGVPVSPPGEGEGYHTVVVRSSVGVSGPGPSAGVGVGTGNLWSLPSPLSLDVRVVRGETGEEKQSKVGQAE
uniref:Uncharacterized protein n=1 Tax=Chromera velia CCMP2878 TaxID=1169474 RepID=A0A0G4I7Z0_9ALVE|eukprot:Cvel_11803.t1-p1 / transcript=Cvel_11803.t1 / gene=Cvel_11803 / organism=Chromera_velia_CCMP2878 / gene_product=hypothetical protein / transcript_product=hypothetical protein / location=Cvel_scaffold751:18647-21362(+) / protein_length=385 / sequence_SO=supercontig / SO=protein_coding / is_pseudo=false